MIFNRSDILNELQSSIIETQFADEAPCIYDSAVFDSRECFEDSIFVAIDGSKSTGIVYVEDAIRNGAACVMANIDYRNQLQDLIDRYGAKTDFIFVEDTLKAFGMLGTLSRSIYTKDVIGVAGSVGKTSTKNMLREIGGGSENTHASRGSFNNETGVPLTLCTLPLDAKRAIVELGESHFGDLDYITKIARPTILIITNVELAHVEYLGDLEGVAQTMNESVSLMPAGSTIVIPNGTNNIDIVLKGVNAKVIKVLDVDEVEGDSSPENVTFAKVLSKVQSPDLTYSFELEYQGMEIEAHIPLMGDHFVMNAALAIIASYVSGQEIPEIVKNLENVVPQGSRMNEIQTSLLTIIDDCYNANPASMRASMKAVKDKASLENSRSVFIMGPMRELGKDSDLMHEEIGRYAQEIGIDLLICVDKATLNASKVGVHLNSIYFESVKDALASIGQIVKKGDLVGVKASRGPDPHKPAMMPIVEALEQLK